MAGENYESIGVCSHCLSWRIRRTQRSDGQGWWLCHDCDRGFPAPRVVQFFITSDMAGYVPASEIPESEILIHNQVTGSGNSTGTRRDSGLGMPWGKLLLAVAVIAAIILAIVVIPPLFRQDNGSDQPPMSTTNGQPANNGQQPVSAFPPPTSTPTPTNISRTTFLPESTPVPTDTPIPPANLQPANSARQPASAFPSPTFTPTPTTVPIPTPTPTATPIPTATPTPTSVPTPTPVPAPNLRHYDEKLYLLELINQERAKVGAPPVILGNNYAAQLHAESSLRNCAGSHWGVDGLKPYMRYSLAGGYQSNGENWLGSDYCITRSDGYRSLGSIEARIRDSMEGWMDSPGHRDNILDKWHKKVNIGLAWDRYNFKAVQHFEGDYVEYDQLPRIESGALYISGWTKNVAVFDDEDLFILVFYDPPPQRLTRGQLSRTYCYGPGLPILGIRKPLTGGWYYAEDERTAPIQTCPNPYDVFSGAPAPKSPEEAHEYWQRAYDASQNRKEQDVTMLFINASAWNVSGRAFSVIADISDVLKEYGAGVYSIIVLARIDDEGAFISQYSIFYGITPPNTYDPRP